MYWKVFNVSKVIPFRKSCPTYFALTVSSDEFDVQQNFSQLKYLFERRQANRSLNNSPADLLSALEVDAMLRCLCFLEDVVESNSGRDVEKSTNEFAKRGVELHDSLDKRSNNVNQPSSTPYQSDERLQLWGAQVAKVFLDAQGVTNHFTRWIRALLLALNTKSVRDLSIGRFDLLIKGLRS